MNEVKLPFNIPEPLLESEEDYRRITQLMPVAVYTTDPDGLITFYNEKAAELWGRKPRLNDPTELPFCGSWKLFEPDGTAMPHNNCPMAKALRHKRSFRGEEIGIERPDGSRMAALVNIDPIFAADGELRGAVNVFYDISEHNRIENDVRRLAAIVASSEDAIISKNLDGVIMSWNRSAERIFGYTEEEILGKSIMLIIPSSRQTEEFSILEKIRKGVQVKHYDTIRLTKSGKKIHISLTVSPIRNANGQIIGASKIARDISEQVQIQRKLKLYNAKLKKLNKYKDDFIGLASHELKTPLTVIKGFLQLIESELQDESHQIFVGKALLQVDKLSNLVSDLLDVSRIQEKKLQLSFTTFNIDELIDECIENIHLSSPDYRFIRQGPRTNLTITADRQRIEQVIINLISNAVKYSPGKDKVIIQTIVEQGEVMVSVQDFGVGISSNYLKKIFSRFFRIEEQEGNFAGLGIGLYISKEIIERHKGTIWVESEPNKGATFYFKIPVSQ